MRINDEGSGGDRHALGKRETLILSVEILRANSIFIEIASYIDSETICDEFAQKFGATILTNGAKGLFYEGRMRGKASSIRGQP